MKSPSRIGDRSTSDVVVRLRTLGGRDDWFYCHSHVLIEKSKYFADRLSEHWPTCQIIDSRNCVEVYCQELEIDYFVNFLRILYVALDVSLDDVWHGVKNTLGILQVAVELGSPQILAACAHYLEAVPWEETDEEEILRVIPGIGSQAEKILDRLQPVDQSAIRRIFLAAFKFATSSCSSHVKDIKTSAQEQLEYMLTEDDDAPLLTADDEIKSIVKAGAKGLFTRFSNLLMTLECKPRESVPVLDNMQNFGDHLSDLSWICLILSKLEIMFEFVNSWVDASDKVLRVVEQECSTTEAMQTKLKVLEVTTKVLEAIGYGSVILPTAKRLYTVKVWLPFVRVTKHLTDSLTTNDENPVDLKIDCELWQSLESALVSILLALPSGNLAEILTEWLQNEHIRYPDFTEAFEVWCYRSKVANRRLGLIQRQIDGMAQGS
ncbi:BTB/POZ domain-containing protein At3g05675 isoform X2 [Euphorbia lathyris]|uniref:BTB/POZ domain-containing protein At3g05675 isoform X2 n=1 Tax=Euphorbia lathyris TaxID=212925 RepID=UPI003314189B